MSNSFYNHGAFPSTGSAATSASMRAELDLVAAGFDKMPTLAGNANKFVIVNSTGTGLTQTDVLPAFTVTDTDFTVQDDGDNTRKFQFNAGSITTGNTRVYVMPDLDTTLVGTNVTQTLTNKTLTAPVIATIVNTGTLTLPTSTDTLVGRNTTDTLTNKTLTNPVIGTIVNTGTLTLPTSTDTLVGRQTTDTLTNKTISGASNTLSNIANGSLSNSSVVIGSTTLSLGGTMTTLAGVTISGASNTLSNIANASLTNSSITINGSTVALGSSVTVTATATNALTIGNGLSGTSYNGSSAVTIAINTGVTADLSTAQTFSNKTISGSANTLSNIANASLTNSAITIGSTAISLGATSLTLAGLTSASATTLISTGNQATSVAISAIGHSSGTVTVTTGTAHGLTTGDTASIDGVADYTFCGVYTVTVTNANVFTYSQTAGGASSSGGFSTKLTGTWGLYAGGTGPSLANGPVMVSASSQMPALRVTQGGSGYALIVEDAANPDTSAFIISNAGDLAINTNKFTVAAASGNTVIAGTTSLNGNVTFATDATYDIGASGATRPRDLFLSRNLVVGGTLTLAGGVNLNGNVTIGDASTDTLTINSTITSNLIFTDNTYDIGASGATRPKNLYLAGSAIVGGDVQLNNANYYKSKIAAGTVTRIMGINASDVMYIGGIDAAISSLILSNTTGTYMSMDGTNITASKNLIFGTDDTYDIGASGATRPRREFLSQSLYIGSPTVSWSTTTRKVLQFGGTGASYFSASQQVTDACFGSLSWNAYGTSTNNEWKYFTGTDRANLFQIAAGGYTWYRAAVGTADATITWTTSLNLDSSGNMGLGGSTTAYNNARLTVVTAATATRQNLAAIDKTTANWVRFTNPEFSTDASMGLILKVFPDSDSRQGAGIIASGGATNNSTNLSLFVTDSNALSFAAYTAAPSGADVLHTWNRTATSTAMTLSTTAELILDSGTSGGRVTISPGATQNTISSTTTGFGAYNILRQQATQYQWLNASSTQVMTLNASGNLGLTSTNPTYQLDMGGGTTVSNRIQLQRGSDDGNQNLLLGWDNISSTRSSVSLSSAQTTLSFNQIGSDGTRTNLYINSNGTIGIGATNSYSWDITRFKAIYFGSASSGNYFSVSQQFTAACAGGLSWNAYGSGNNTFKYMTTGDPASRLSMAGNQIRLFGAPVGTADADITFTEMLGMQKDYSVALQGASNYTGTGITFPATQSASSNANTLDDYEEGTWTPTLVASGATFTYTASTGGTYVKIGRLVLLSGVISLASKSGGAGSSMAVSNLPFAAGAPDSNGSGQGLVFTAGIGGYTLPAGYAAPSGAVCTPNTASAYPLLTSTLGGAASVLNIDSLSGTGYIQFSMTYYANT
jgi:hypothetical protein